MNLHGLANYRTILRASEQRGPEQDGAGSHIRKTNKQSFGKDIVANCGAACQAKLPSMQKGLTAGSLRVRLAMVNRHDADDSFLAKLTVTRLVATARRRS
jgi:hypothetical protein